MRALILALAVLTLLTACTPKVDLAMLNWKASEQCHRMGIDGAGCAGDLLASEPSQPRPMWGLD